MPGDAMSKDGSKAELDLLLSARAKLDLLLANGTVTAVEKRAPEDLPGQIRTFLATNPENPALGLAVLLRRADTLVLPSPAENFERLTPRWPQVAQAVDAGELGFIVEGPNGLRVTIPSKAAETEAERTKLCLARALQLADKLLSNECALRLAEVAMAQGLHAAQTHPPRLLAAAGQAILGEPGDKRPREALRQDERVVLDVPVRKSQVVQVRVANQAWGSGLNFGLGFSVSARGRLKVLVKQAAQARGRFSNQPHLLEAGQYLCTTVTRHPLTGDGGLEGLGFLDGESARALGAAATTLSWDEALDEEELPSDSEAWVDAEGDRRGGGEGSAEEEEAAEWEARGQATKRRRAFAAKSFAKPETAARLPSAAVEVLCWGDNEHGELSDPDRTVLPSPGPLLWAPLAPWEQVRVVSTSARHSAVVTSLGGVYTCGDGGDGALGHGDLASHAHLKLVTYFSDSSTSSGQPQGQAGEGQPGCELVGVSCGADLFGSHTACLDSRGRVYTFGLGSACGRGNRRPHPVPGRVVIEHAPSGNEADGLTPPDPEEGDRVAQVCAGGGFCLALTRSGLLWAWGNWMGGRLGLGPVPSKEDTSYMHSGSKRKRLLPLLLRPRRVRKGLESCGPLASVSCGDAHCAAVTQRGQVLVWGQNESGQLGLGPSRRSGRLENHFYPTPLPPFKGFGDHPALFGGGGGSLSGLSGLSGGGLAKAAALAARAGASAQVAVHVACGGAHTLAIDARGEVWAWGGLGGACIGLGGDDAGSASRSASRSAGPAGGHTLRPTSELQAARAVRQRAGESMGGEVPAWSLPRHVAALEGCRAVGASAGERHSVVLLRGGGVAMCGDGVGLLHRDAKGGAKADKKAQARPKPLAEAEAAEAEAAEAEAGGEGGERATPVGPGEEDPGETAAAVAKELEGCEACGVPRMPCATWFPLLESKYLVAAACGGQHTLVLSKGEKLGLVLGRKLLQAAKLPEEARGTAAKIAAAGSNSEEEGDKAAAGSSDEEDEDGGVFLGQAGGADCVLLTTGRPLGAHRIVLARRSRVLREMIAAEERPGLTDGGMLELLMPELRRDTALALREFLYTDTVTAPLVPGSALPEDLLEAATRFDLPRLAALARKGIPPRRPNIAPRPRPGKGGPTAGGTANSSQAQAAAAAASAAMTAAAASAASVALVPPSTLVADLGGGLGDTGWADLKFVAGGRPIFAHSALLAAASDYFKTMFKMDGVLGFGYDATSASSQGGGGYGRSMEGVVEVVVPDSHVAMLRLLLFSYTGMVGNSDWDEAVVEDLVAADRYMLLDMKRTCESLVAVDAGNCLSALQVAHAVNAPRLKQEALRRLVLSLHIPEVEAAALELAEAQPDLGKLVLEKLQHMAAARARDKHHVASSRRPGAMSEDEKLSAKYGVFPLGSLLAALGLALVYAYTSKFIVLGPLVPVFNVLGLAALLVWGTFYSKDLT